MIIRRWSSVIFALAAVFAASAGSAAELYPARPIRLVMPYSPGGIVDYVGRTVGQHLADMLGQPVVPENRPGAGGIAGTDAVARAAADGYTLLIMDPAIVINPALQTNVLYDPFRQLQTVSIISSSPEVLVAAPSLPVTSVQSLIAYGKANPGKLNFASAGIGTTPHLAGEMFKQRTGIEATHVPYRSIGQSYPDLMTGKVQFAFSSIAGALPFTSDNRVRALATTGLTRSAIYPDQPTMDEAGLKGFQVDLWLGIFLPAGVSADVVERLSTALDTILKQDGMKTALAKVGVEPRGTRTVEGAAILKSEFDKWKKVIEESKINPN